MPIICPGCKTENPGGFKFCGGCGNPLSGLPTADSTRAVQPIPPARPDRRSEERKIVTILFADLRGFTALSEKLDPEEVHDTIQVLFKRLTLIIKRYGGTVDKYIGDCIMALFGAPLSHGNDPERSIRASLEMQAEVKKFRVERSIDIGMRIGINTGMVLAGYVGERAGDYTVIGDDVNLASRVEEAAPVDGIMVTHKTYYEVSEIFDFEQLDPIQVKGKTNLIRVYRVLRETPPEDEQLRVRGRKIETQMVGRETELTRMLSFARMSREQKKRQFIMVIAPAGVGKSRLIYEFHRDQQELEYPPVTFRGRALPYTMNIPYYLFGNILKNKFGIIDENTGDEARTKLLKGIMDVMVGSPDNEVEEITHLIATLINIDFPESPIINQLKKDPVQLKQRAHQAFIDFFRHTTVRPTVIYLEDIQWAEQSSLDLAIDIFHDCRTRPLLMIAVARPEFNDRFPDILNSFADAEIITLETLPPDALRELLRDHLKKVETIPGILDRLVIERSGGNPYYAEELIKMFIEAGVIQTDCDDGRWRIIEERIEEVEIPHTIQELLQSRLDNLKVNEKGVLQRAAVVGRTFWQGAIDILLDDLTITRSEPLLRELRKKEFVFDTRQSSFMGDEYIFKHALLRDVTYETILRKKRMQYHARVAEWIELNGGDRREEFLPIIAMHYELGRKFDLAREYYFLAGERARMTFANQEALAYFDKTVELADDPKFSHYRRRGSIREILGDYKGALEDYIELKKRTRNRMDEGICLKHLTEIHIRLGDYVSAKKLADRATAIGDELDDPRMIAETLNLLGRIYDYTGETGKALKYYTQSMEKHREHDNKLGEATGLGNIGIIHMYRGEYDRAITAYKAALDIDRSQDNKRRMTMMMSNIGEAYQFLGAIDIAANYHRDALSIARLIGFKMMQVECLRNLGIEHIYQSKEDGLNLLEESLEMVEDINDMELLPQVLYSRGEGLVLSGKSSKALKTADRLLKIVEERNVKDYIAKGILLKSRCIPRGEHVDELKRGLGIAHELQSHSLLWEFYYALMLSEAETTDRQEYIKNAVEEIYHVANSIADEELRKTFLESKHIRDILECCK